MRVQYCDRCMRSTPHRKVGADSYQHALLELMTAFLWTPFHLGFHLYECATRYACDECRMLIERTGALKAEKRLVNHETAVPTPSGFLPRKLVWPWHDRC